MTSLYRLVRGWRGQVPRQPGQVRKEAATTSPTWVAVQPLTLFPLLYLFCWCASSTGIFGSIAVRPDQLIILKMPTRVVHDFVRLRQGWQGRSNGVNVEFVCNVCILCGHFGVGFPQQLTALWRGSHHFGSCIFGVGNRFHQAFAF